MATAAGKDDEDGRGREAVADKEADTGGDDRDDAVDADGTDDVGDEDNTGDRAVELAEQGQSGSGKADGANRDRGADGAACFFNCSVFGGEPPDSSGGDGEFCLSLFNSEDSRT